MLLLAPMEDVTDTTLRRAFIQLNSIPDIWFTEFTNATGLLKAPIYVGHRLVYHPEEMRVPLIAQLWGTGAEDVYRASVLVFFLGFAGVDLNMGCPVKNVVKTGAGAALAENYDLAASLINAVKRARDDFMVSKGSRSSIEGPSVRIQIKNHVAFGSQKEDNIVQLRGRTPLVSVKTRLGFKKIDLEWIKFLLEQQIDILTVHFRTARDMSKVPARWEYAKYIRQLRDTIAPNTVLVGNGDVFEAMQAREILEHQIVDGVMIGRGIFKRPLFFREFQNSNGRNLTAQDYQCKNSGDKGFLGREITRPGVVNDKISFAVEAYSWQVYYFIESYCLKGVVKRWNRDLIKSRFWGRIKGGGWGGAQDIPLKNIRSTLRLAIAEIFSEISMQFRDLYSYTTPAEAFWADLPQSFHKIIDTASSLEIIEPPFKDTIMHKLKEKLLKASTPCIRSYKPLLKFSKMWL